MGGESGRRGLSEQALAGISIAAAAAALILLAVACWLYFFKCREQQLCTQRVADSRRAPKLHAWRTSAAGGAPHSAGAPHKSTWETVSSLQVQSQHQTSTHSTSRHPARLSAGPESAQEAHPAANTAESSGRVSSWLNKLTHTKIMTWLQQEQSPSPLTRSATPSMHSMHDMPGGVAPLQPASADRSSLAQSSINLNCPSMHHAWLQRHGLSPSMHEMSPASTCALAHEAMLSPYAQPPTGGSASGTSMATSAHAQPLPPMHLQFVTGASVSSSTAPPDLVPPSLGQDPTGDSTSSATLALPYSLPPLSAAQPTMQPTGGCSARSCSLTRTCSTGQLWPPNLFAPPQGPQALASIPDHSTAAAGSSPDTAGHESMLHIASGGFMGKPIELNTYSAT